MFLAEAKALGKAIAEAGLGLVYGGASVGLMGAVADAALAGGAEVIGVLPEILAGSEIAHRGLTRLGDGSHDARAQGTHGETGGCVSDVARRAMEPWTR